MRQLYVGFAGAVAIASSTILAQQDAQSPLKLFVVPEGYISPSYAHEPELPATRMIFEGETLSLRVDIRNEGTSALALIGDEAPGFQVGISRLDGKTVVLPAIPSSDAVSRVYRSQPAGDRWSRRMLIAPAETLRWIVPLPVGQAPAGLYEIRVTTSAKDENGKAVHLRIPDQVVEVRHPSDDDSVELATRAVSRAILKRDYDEAERLAREAVMEFPTSAVAHSQLSTILAARGRDADAADSLVTAINILDRGVDTRLLQVRSAASIAQTVSSMRERLAKMRQDRPQRP